MITIISPMYNEEDEISSHIEKMSNYLSNHFEDWEWIIVDDGSKDKSQSIVKNYSLNDERIRLISYPENRGRGYALRKGFSHSKGSIVVTIEADGSWGENIIQEMVNELKKTDHYDLIIASLHLPSGGYKNVPFHRRLLSSYGNKILQFSFPKRITMATGMTRAYRKWVIDALELESERKEIHLEILSKAFVVVASVKEIPAVLSWPKKRRGRSLFSLSNVKLLKVIFSHLFFGFKELVVFVFLFLSLILMMFGLIGIFYLGLVKKSLNDHNSTNYLLLIFQGFQILMFTFLAYQNKKTKMDIIRLNRTIKKNFNQNK